MGAFHAEIQKARRRHDLLICLLMPVIIILWAGGLRGTADPEELASGYSALFYSIPVINSLVLPVFMAVLASRLWDMEIKGSTCKLLYTLQSRRSLFIGKVWFGVTEVLLVTVTETLAVLLTGSIQAYTQKLPVGQLLYLAVCTLTVELMLFFGELLVMLVWKNPLPALSVGIVGALLGLFSAFLPPVVSYFVPSGYFIPLGAYVVANWDKATHTVTYGTRQFNIGLLIFTLVLGLVFFGAAWHCARSQEV